MKAIITCTLLSFINATNDKIYKSTPVLFYITATAAIHSIIYLTTNARRFMRSSPMDIYIRIYIYTNVTYDRSLTGVH